MVLDISLCVLSDLYNKEKFGFFEEFVMKQYAREIQEYQRIQEQTEDAAIEDEIAEREETVKKMTILQPNDNHSTSTLDVLALNDNHTTEMQWCFEVEPGLYAKEYRVFQQRKSKKLRHDTYHITVDEKHKQFEWAMYRTKKKVRTGNRHTYSGGYWWICTDSEVNREIRDWTHDEKEVTKRKKAKKKARENGKDRKWLGPPIRLKHLNVILGLVNHHHRQMADPEKRRKILKRRPRGGKRINEPIFKKFLPAQRYCHFCL